MPRQPSARETRAQADAMLARVDAMFDQVFADVRDLTDSARAAGLLRDPGSRTRAGDARPTGEGAR